MHEQHPLTGYRRVARRRLHLDYAFAYGRAIGPNIECRGAVSLFICTFSAVERHQNDLDYAQSRCELRASLRAGTRRHYPHVMRRPKHSKNVKGRSWYYKPLPTCLVLGASVRSAVEYQFGKPCGLCCRVIIRRILQTHGFRDGTGQAL